jgi:hypothetical protein
MIRLNVIRFSVLLAPVSFSCAGRLPADEREITVPTNGEVKIDFVHDIKNLPQT